MRYWPNIHVGSVAATHLCQRPGEDQASLPLMSHSAAHGTWTLEMKNKNNTTYDFSVDILWLLSSWMPQSGQSHGGSGCSQHYAHQSLQSSYQHSTLQLKTTDYCRGFFKHLSYLLITRPRCPLSVSYFRTQIPSVSFKELTYFRTNVLPVRPVNIPGCSLIPLSMMSAMCLRAGAYCFNM